MLNLLGISIRRAAQQCLHAYLDRVYKKSLTSSIDASSSNNHITRLGSLTPSTNYQQVTVAFSTIKYQLLLSKCLPKTLLSSAQQAAAPSPHSAVLSKQATTAASLRATQPNSSTCSKPAISISILPRPFRSCRVM